MRSLGIVIVGDVLFRGEPKPKAAQLCHVIGVWKSR